MTITDPHVGDDPAPREVVASPREPKATGHLVELPEPLGYRVKKKLLGPPLHSERIVHERLGKPTALAVFASDCLSSSAYATEEILRVLIPVIGALAFSMVMPITTAILIVLLLLILSYRQTIKEYPSAGGAYIVTRDNFGLLPAQVAGVALLTDYILTVSVSVAAGSAAIGSLVEGLAPYTLEMSIAFVIIIAAINLKGVKESGLAFSVPTYFFVLMMAILAIVGAAKMMSGNLPTAEIGEGAMTFGNQGVDGALFAGAGLFIVLKAFASGGAAVTGVEAISNGVPAFKEPAWRNARSTLVIMGFLAGGMFLTVSFLAWKIQPVPYAEGTPTVISQVGEAVFGDQGVGHIMFALFQIGTTLILVLAANTSFADFPRLASFHAGDNFMPRQLTKRGHRLVFSNGIISLAIAAVVLLLVTDAQVDRLIPLYAIGVFLSFTLSQAGMSKHHVTKKEPGWRRGLVINAAGAVVSGVVCVVIAATKFTQGAWFIILLVPFLVWVLMRLNRQYESEEEVLIRAAPKAASQPILRRHVVVVLVDTMDMASARALQYARTLTPDELSAVHFDLDPIRTEDLADAWTRTGYDRIPLDIVACPDRRLDRAAAEVVARHLVDGDTEVSVLIPRREYSRFWHRLVHDRTADDLSRTLSTLPHCNVTVVPFHIASPSEVPHLIAPVGKEAAAEGAAGAKGRKAKAKAKAVPTIDLGDFELPTDRTPIADVTFRQRVRVAGKVYALRVQPWSGTPALELTLIDDSGALLVVFLGRRQLAGVKVGSRLVVEGVVGEHKGRMAMLNPVYELQADPHALAEAPPAH
ncbi:MAG: amino acid permease [Acidimicrobiales bacterium]